VSARTAQAHVNAGTDTVFPDTTVTVSSTFPRAIEAGSASSGGLLLRVESDGALTDRLLAPLRAQPRGWRAAFLVSLAGTLVFVVAAVYTMLTGIGVWGNNVPVAWGFAIVNFVWWIGIGHAGTFLSAFLLLMDQRWRSSINRVAEAMTLFALVNAGLFPILHLGRPWFAYWLIPYPSSLDVWPQFKSTLPWDFAAITTYVIVSVLFWYAGLLPDLATARDAHTGRRRIVYGVLALGWSGAGEQWRQHRIALLLLAGLATPLVISVHSIVSLDFAIAQLPGWHSTIFPPYFVAGAIYSGLAMVLVILLPVRRLYGLQTVITARHFDNIAKLMLVLGWVLLYCYALEIFLAWYSGVPFERYTYLSARPVGPWAVLFWAMILLNLATPQLFWSRRFRSDGRVLFGAGIAILIGMWLERFIIVVTSQARDFLPASWAGFTPTVVDWALLGGSIGLFTLLFLLFLRFVPPVPIAELKHMQRELLEEGG
jgi:Ni/Fe-hydrogenase subunit HybB-like protein